MLYLIFALILSLLVAVFAVQNAILVTVDFFAWRLEMSLVLIILTSLLTGILITSSYLMKLKFNQYLSDKKFREQIEILEKKEQELLAEIKLLKPTEKLLLDKKEKTAGVYFEENQMD